MTDTSTRQPTPEEMRRLMLVRHLYILGIDQTRGPEPTSGLAVLAFHDAAEMFLQLAAERHGMRKERPDFMDYFKELESAGVALAQREAMRRLNAARRSLKHQGILPASVELEGFRAATTNFLEDNCPAVFAVEFDRISMVALVRNAEVRGALERAEAAEVAGDYMSALSDAAVAFNMLVNVHEGRRRGGHPLAHSYSLRDPFGWRMPMHTRGHGTDRKVEAVAESLAKNMDRLEGRFAEALTVVGYGLDFDTYLYFKSITPVVLRLLDGRYQVQWMQTPTKDAELVGRCIGFVVDAAIRLDARARGEGG